MDRFEADVMDDLMSDAAEGPAARHGNAYDEFDEYDEGDEFDGADEGDDEFLGRLLGGIGRVAGGLFGGGGGGDGFDEGDEFDGFDEGDEFDGFDAADEDGGDDAFEAAVADVLDSYGEMLDALTAGMADPAETFAASFSASAFTASSPVTVKRTLMSFSALKTVAVIRHFRKPGEAAADWFAKAEDDRMAAGERRAFDAWMATSPFTNASAPPGPMFSVSGGGPLAADLVTLGAGVGLGGGDPPRGAER